jgi:hypothetical protein
VEGAVGAEGVAVVVVVVVVVVVLLSLMTTVSAQLVQYPSLCVMCPWYVPGGTGDGAERLEVQMQQKVSDIDRRKEIGLYTFGAHTLLDLRVIPT